MSINKNFIATLFTLALLAALAAPTALAQHEPPSRKGHEQIPMKKQIELDQKAAKLPSGPDFYIEAVPGLGIQYSILLTDSNNRSVPSTFIRQQIEIFEALLLAGKEFALNEEEVGTPSKPKITRFMDKHEKSFIIDVQKVGDRSHFFLTIDSLFGRLTVDAGAIRRGNKKSGEDEPEPLYYKIITRVQTAKTTIPQNPQIQQ
jgi:hypothetical protein